MSDNVQITSGTGTSIAADELVDGTLGTVKVQYVKLMDGTIDGTTKGVIGSNGLQVDVQASSGIGSLTEAVPASDTASSGLNGRLQRIAQRLSSLITLVPTALSGSGNFKVAVSEAMAAGTNVIGKVGIDQTTPGTTNAVQLAAAVPAGTNTIGGVTRVPSATATAATLSRVTSASSTNATSVKGSAGRLYSVRLFNSATSARYVKFYDKATSPTVGTDTPLFILPLPAGGGYSEPFDFPVSFASGIAYAITGGIADNDTTAVTAADVNGFIQYL